MRAHLLVIQHEDDAPPAWFGEWLEAADIELSVVLAHRGEPVPADLDRFHGLLVLGGAMGAYDDVTCPWLTATKELIAATIAADDRPFLGICLGHQLAAVASGGTVTRNPRGSATGLTPVGLTSAGRLDPWLAGLPQHARAVQWNDDIVTALAPGQDIVALAPDGTIQAARFASRAWGVQFHPEVSPDVFAAWGTASAASGAPGPDPARIAAAADDIRAAEEELRRTWRPVAERFARLVLAAAAAPEPASEGSMSTVRQGR